jgi:hypothetical protein
MAEELNDAEYAALLAGGNVSVAWHGMTTFNYEAVNEAMTQAAYNAVRQVFSDRLSVTLPEKCPDLFAKDSG